MKALKVLVIALAAIALYLGGRAVWTEVQVYQGQKMAVAQMYQFLAAPVGETTNDKGEKIVITRADRLAELAKGQ